MNAYEGMRNDNTFMPPGVETWGFVEALSAFLSGEIAMTISWPPFGRWAVGYGTDDSVMHTTAGACTTWVSVTRRSDIGDLP